MHDRARFEMRSFDGQSESRLPAMADRGVNETMRGRGGTTLEGRVLEWVSALL